MFTELDVCERAVWSEAAFCHVSTCESCGLACVLGNGGDWRGMASVVVCGQMSTDRLHACGSHGLLHW